MARAKGVKLPGGSTRAEVALPYHLVPPAGVRRIAARFALGAKTYGVDDWKRSVEDEDAAGTFCKDVHNHAVEHALKMAAGEEPKDDHLGAIGWAVTVLAYAEERYGCAWTDI